MITLLADPERLAGATLTVSGEPYRHLFRARRVAVGERLRVVDGEGRARFGEVAGVGKAAATVTLLEPAPDCEPAVRVELLVTTLKPERAAWLVEKATEVGVAAIRFLHSARAPRTFGDGTIERLRRVAAAAVEQCGRARLPPVTGTHSWQEVETLTPGLAERRFLDTVSNSATALGELGGEPGGEPGGAPGALALFVGPEGGWTDEEREGLRRLGWRPVRLGSRVLRTETAAVVGVARFVMP